MGLKGDLMDRKSTACAILPLSRPKILTSPPYSPLQPPPSQNSLSNSSGAKNLVRQAHFIHTVRQKITKGPTVGMSREMAELTGREKQYSYTGGMGLVGDVRSLSVEAFDLPSRRPRPLPVVLLRNVSTAHL